MTVRTVQVTFDCADTRRVGEFWQEALGYVTPPVPPGFDSWDELDASLLPERQGSAWACQDPEGVGPRLFFQRVPEGKTVKNRVHLDVRVGTGLSGDERVAALCSRGTPAAGAASNSHAAVTPGCPHRAGGCPGTDGVLDARDWGL